MAPPSSSLFPATGEQAIVANLEAPRLKEVATSDFVQIMRGRKIYELDVEEKNKAFNKSIVPRSYN